MKLWPIVHRILVGAAIIAGVVGIIAAVVMGLLAAAHWPWYVIAAVAVLVGVYVAYLVGALVVDRP